MKREFVRTPAFEKSWENCGLNDDDMRELENELLNNPSAGAVIPHMEGARKVRIALDGRGKSGGARVIYIDVVVKERIYLLLAYKKNQYENLSTEQKYILSAIIRELKEE